jgi:hypothetical protein
MLSTPIITPIISNQNMMFNRHNYQKSPMILSNNNTLNLNLNSVYFSQPMIEKKETTYQSFSPIIKKDISINSTLINNINNINNAKKKRTLKKKD